MPETLKGLIDGVIESVGCPGVTWTLSEQDGLCIMYGGRRKCLVVETSRAAMRNEVSRVVVEMVGEVGGGTVRPGLRRVSIGDETWEFTSGARLSHPILMDIFQAIDGALQSLGKRAGDLEKMETPGPQFYMDDVWQIREVIVAEGPENFRSLADIADRLEAWVGERTELGRVAAG